jgi:ABC-2 type transport system permease protein
MNEFLGALSLELRQILGGRKVLMLAALAAFPLGLVVLMRTAGDMNTDELGEYRHIPAIVILYLFYAQAFCTLGSLLYGSTMVQVELEQKTWIYIATRPVGRLRLMLAKYSAGALAVTIAATLSYVPAYFLLLPGYRAAFAPLLAAVVLSALGYMAIFALIGVLATRRAMTVGLVYGIIFEGVLSLFPALVNRLTVTHYLRTLVVAWADLPIPPDMEPFIGDAGVLESLLVLAGIVTVAFGAACAIVSRRQLVSFSEA